MKYIIENIRKGKGDRSHIVYACLFSVSEDGQKQLCISATLAYILERLESEDYLDKK